MAMKSYMRVAGVAGRILLAFLFVFSQSAWAGQDPKAKDNAKPAQQAAARPTGEKSPTTAAASKVRTEDAQSEESENARFQEKPSGDGKREGIKVHGHWTIEVKNPDGTLVAHREFDNSLLSSGGTLLSNLLARQSSGGALGIGVGFGTSGGTCTVPGLPSFIFQYCIMFEPGFDFTTLQWLFVAPNLYLGVPANSTTRCLGTVGCYQTATVASAGGLVSISGTFVATTAGSVNQVNALEVYCTNTNVGPKNCALSAGTADALTQAVITPVPVAAGQTIAVTVNISFS